MQKNNKKFIVVFGIGLSGESTLRYLIHKKFEVLVWDDDRHLREFIKKKYPKVLIKELKKIDWKNAAMIIVSPGIALNHTKLKEPLKFKIPIYRDLEIFIRDVDKKKVIAVTGTNGKSTTVSLIGHLLRKNQKKNIFVGGNIGKPLLDSLQKITYEKYVVELSSYQLESAPNFESYISILLNIREDHLDRYKFLNNYVKYKKRIFQNIGLNQFAIIGIDDSSSLKIYNELKISVKNLIPISTTKKLKKGISFINNKIIDNYFTNKIIDLSDNRLKVDIINRQNVTATYAVSKILNYKKNHFFDCVKTYKPLKHRNQKIYFKGNLLIINDSKATNLSATLETIKSNSNIFLIMGGRLKHNSFKDLINFKDKLKKIYLIGESKEFIFNELNLTIKCIKCKNLNNAVLKSLYDAKNNIEESTILLSPACSSFDQYKNFEERGNHFINLINKNLDLL
ncbi:MAG: UDP-N-acetylmuramoylalanine--D-glutamate ligase [Alphaproteobacteria bacterium MarineAlpha5_Bin10]|nr:MAG: UDP-N-acetylmuramoylalanine--D-glutamate ligase [Alphaproteobacteria bacterium MarineAlpha5_Bin10]